MDKQKRRSEIEEKYKWDLKRVYKTEEDFDRDYKKLKSLVLKIEDYKDNLFKDASFLEEYLHLSEDISSLLNKLYLYAHLKSDEDVSNVKYQKLSSQIMDVMYDINNKSSFIDSLFFKEDFNHILEMLDTNDFLKSYKRYFENMNRYREHFLEEDKERIVSCFAKALDTTDEIFNVLDNSELKFNPIKDENNRKVELTEANYSVYIKSNNRRVREEAFKSLYNTYGNFKNTISAIYMGNVDSNMALAKVYNFNSKLEEHLYADNIDIEVYNNLLKEVDKALPYLHDYYKFKKRALDLREFHLYDTYVNLVDDNSHIFTYEEARDKVLEVIKPLGEDYVKKARYIFDNRLIDVMPNLNKRGGGYSSSTYDTDPYILLNFNGEYNDVSTMAHELGHSMHSIYSRDANFRQYADYSIFVAEIASVVNEILLALYNIKNSNDKKEKLSIMNKLLDNYKATIYRQSMFAEFEKGIYERREAGESLTNLDISNYYLELNKKYFGDSVVVDEEIKYEWERIPHFYTPFYVYQYATSMSAAVVIANKIFNGDLEFRDRYLEFLKLGGRSFPLDEVRTLGIDLVDGSVVHDALEEFNKLLVQFKDLYREVYND